MSEFNSESGLTYEQLLSVAEELADTYDTQIGEALDAVGLNRDDWEFHWHVERDLGKYFDVRKIDYWTKLN